MNNNAALAQPRPFFDVMRELNRGHAIHEASQAIHEACNAASEHGKEATVTITIKVKPMKQTRLVEPAMIFSAEVDKKLPKAPTPEDIFFINQNGQPVKEVTRQSSLDVVPAAQQQGA